MKNVFIFTAGLLLGSGVTFIATKKFIQKRADEEIEEVREAYRKMKNDTDNSEKREIVEEKNELDEELENDRVEYEHIASQYTKTKEDSKTQKMNYSDICTRDKTKPYIIHPDEFEEIEDYDSLEFMYYVTDNILADERDDVVNNVEDIVGLDFKKHFGEYEEDAVYVRNDKYKIDYEILLSERSYLEDHPNYQPQEVEE